MKLRYKFIKTDYPVNSKITLPVGIRKAKFRADDGLVKEVQVFIEFVPM